ncbi:MAG: hypothetical protein LW875_12025 [Proteobacteria bacterium]|nr:hypothetical protein [Pseudomonadota bacterium]
MKKILLVYDDFNELTLTESYLKRVGFDVLGIGNEILINEQILGFNPDLIVAYGRNHRVSSVSVGQKLKDHRSYQGKVLIVVPQGFRPTAQEVLKMKADGLMETPFTADKLIGLICKVMSLDSKLFLEKWKKVEREVAPAVVEKREKYQRIAESTEMDIEQTSFQRGDVRSRQQDLKKDWDFDKLEDQDKLKREFAKALFKKSKK